MKILHEKSNLTRLIQSHKGLEAFDYDVSIDWAVELLQKGIISDNIEMLASFSKPADYWEIKPYVQNVLIEFNLKEFEEDGAIQNYSYFYVSRILEDAENILSSLYKLWEICIDSGYEQSIYPFYLLKYSWEDLQDFEFSSHYPEVTLSNFTETVLSEATIWMKNFEKSNNF